MSAPTESLRIVDQAGAGALVGQVMETLRALESVLARESDHIRVGRLDQGLAETGDKTGLSAAYLQGLETIKANATALMRFAPEGIAALKEAHQRFTEAVTSNQAVLATAHSVSEGLVKALSQEMSRAHSATVYGRPSRNPSPYIRPGMESSLPLVLSRNL
ncbi:hypothetical protein PMNALOAF_1215 [Methylobacterium adhaesivum]|jgi:hypothetical protein|uniref:Flagellar protein FlgN n=1 Tax=Methylobacterium adhaesivum TaxID=333297 RepID=A0ABT8BFK1_9HYPH|nr:hypothetical protein [Methylobacterium adhaesivum]MDN3590638.1 hypothetical protein [Methylobacterium adhaesivum]GJD29973.1 hypothetical protein PMNALOAF_1215 [Methylobacterium adhaesivum]